jgi:hypothetical protein
LPGADGVDLCSPTLPKGRIEIEWLLPDGAPKVALGMTDGAAISFAPGFNLYIARLPINRPLPKDHRVGCTKAAGRDQRWRSERRAQPGLHASRRPARACEGFLQAHRNCCRIDRNGRRTVIVDFFFPSAWAIRAPWVTSCSKKPDHVAGATDRLIGRSPASSGDGECPQHLEALVGGAQMPAMFIDEHLSTWDVRC